MNEEIDESEFYHQDFTTASDWEVFIARIEEIINQWKTDDKKNKKTTDANVWDIRSETLTFADNDFCLHSYKFFKEASENLESREPTENDNQQNMIYMDTLHDFELHNDNNHDGHLYLSTWYGLNEYIVLAPANNVDIISENKIKILLSSAYIVSNSISCHMPIFVQIRENWQHCYLGVFESETIRTNYEMVHLRTCPQQYLYVNGLLELFKEKIMSPCSIDQILISHQASYELTDFGNLIWKQELPDGDFNIESLFILPFGVSIDPINSIILKATWNKLSEFLIVDSEFRSYFNPMNAVKWSCLANKTFEPLCLLGEVLSEFIHNLDNNSSVYDVLGDFVSLPSLDSNPLDVLTEPAVPAITTFLSRAARNSLSKNRRVNPPINESVLVPMLYFLFPDADASSSHPYGGGEEEEYSERNDSKITEEFKGFKTATVDSLCWRLSIVLAHALQSLGGVKAFCHIWYEFVQEMRYRWENSLPIPGLAPGVPDLRTCLLNQKLQMLNCCIERKLSRETSRQSVYDSAEGSDTDDEFFDCSDKVDDETKRREKHSLWNQPVGRLSRLGNLRLLRNGDPLYIPVTQEPVPKTEDQLEEDTDVLLKLGSDAEASELRARIMSASLLSDMESFKAANPGSVVEDFIRWYSPRDWIEEEELASWGQKKGHLSPRMLMENNIWVQMWEASRPVPASRQKRLFDDTREAEKVLQFLDCLTVAQICDLTIPVLSHAAIHRLAMEHRPIAADLPSDDSAARMSALLTLGERISRDPPARLPRLEALLREATALELLVAQAHSLRRKLGEPVAGLVVGAEVEIAGAGGSAVGGRLAAMFAAAQVAEVVCGRPFEEAFPAPCRRETVLTVGAVRPACHSEECPQFLRVIVDGGELRMAGAFSEDVAFF